MQLLDITNLFLNVCSLIWCCSGQDAGVGEAGLEQGDEHKHKEDSSNNRYAAGQVFDQERTTEKQTQAGVITKAHWEKMQTMFCHI